MNILDVRTVLFSYVISNLICLAVMISLWGQNRKSSSGMGFWLADYGLQLLSLWIIALRGVLPDFISLAFGTILNLLGTLFLYMGLENYFGHNSSKIYNFILLGVISLLHLYFSFIQPNLGARNILFSAGLLVLSGQIAWFMMRKVDASLRAETRPVGLLFVLYGLVSAVRIITNLFTAPNNDLLKTGLFDTLTILIYQMLFISLTFALFLLVNRRLITALEIDISKRKLVEENLIESTEKFRQLFENSPMGISMTAVDGTLQVNNSFRQILGYSLEELRTKKIADITHPDDLQKSAEVMKTLLEGSLDEVRLEKRYIHKNGQVIWAEISSYLQRGKQGEPQFFITTVNDINERKRSEEALRENELRYRMLFNTMLDGFALHEIICDANGKACDYRFLEINPAFENMTGLKSAEIIGKTVLTVLPGTEFYWIDTYGKVALTGEAVRFENYSRELGKYFEVLAFSPRKNQFATLTTDITERKKMDENLRESEYFLQESQRASLTGAYNFDIANNTWSCTPVLDEIFGIGPDYHKTTENWLGLIHPEQSAEMLTYLQTNVLTNKQPFDKEYRIVRQNDQQTRWVYGRGELTFDENGNPIRMVGTIQDVTDRKLAEEKLNETRAMLQAAFDNSQAGMAIAEASEGKLIYENRAAVAIQGKSMAGPIDNVGMAQYVSAWNILHLDGKPYQPEEVPLARAIMSGETISEEFLIRRDNLEDRIVLANAAPILDEKGHVKYGIVVFLDITEQKHIETLLHLRLKLLEYSNSHSLKELIGMTLSEAGDLTSSPIRFFNFVESDQTHLTLQAWSLRMAQGFNNTETNEKSYPIEQTGIWADAVRTKMPVIHNDYAELPYRYNLPKGQTEVKSELVVPVLRNDKVAALLGIANKPFEYNKKDIEIVTYLADTLWEIAERKRAEEILRTYSEKLENEVQQRTHELRETQEKLVRQERLAMLGQLAGSVSHELRNPLGVISNAVYYLRMAQPDTSPKIKEYLGIIEKETRSADKIISDLLNFTRIKSAEREPVSLGDLVEQALQRYPVPASVSLSVDIPKDLPAVQVDPSQITQVVGNLVINACQAMEQGGELKISARIFVNEDKPQVQIGLKDTGAGILPENMSKLFEPLFTTKAKGIGLGLAICKTLVEGNEGHIEVQSTPGQGSEFTIYLPIAKETV